MVGLHVAHDAGRREVTEELCVAARRSRCERSSLPSTLAFCEWPVQFAEERECGVQTTSGRRGLVLLDVHCAPMSQHTLRKLREAAIIAYVLPAHAAGASLPPDAGVVGALKGGRNDLVDSRSSTGETPTCVVVDACAFMRQG
jgi:hypothetical protein